MIRIAIDAQLIPGGEWGGIEQFVTALVHALGKLDDGLEEYVIIAHAQSPDWLRPYLGRNQHIIVNPMSRLDVLKAWLGPLRKTAGKLWRGTQRAIGIRVPVSTGFYESLNADVIHFPHHAFVRCGLPTIYSPHDLQHVHYPQFFPREEVMVREAVYRTGCQLARAIVTDSRWTKDDVVRQYGVDAQKVFSVAMGPPTDLYGTIEDQYHATVARNFQLPQEFALYPAQTWEHKNHIRLLEAIANLRDSGKRVHLVCTGKQNAFWGCIQRRIAELNLRTQVSFLGFVDATDLRALYHLAQFVVHPSLFEGGGLTVLEAFREGTPLACSSVTSLPEYAGDAALFFDPTSVESIADALRRMSTDPELRAKLIQRGKTRVRKFTWERTARGYRALYRLTAGHALTEEERTLLSGF